MKQFVFALTLIFLSPMARAQVRFNADERRIITLTDERRDADSLLPYLDSKETKVAWRAAIGIANIGDTSVRAALLQHFGAEARDSVADAEAFALGLLGKDRVAHNALLIATIQHPTVERVKALARIEPDDRRFGSGTAKMIATLGENHRLSPMAQVEGYLILAMQRADTAFPRMRDELELLAGDDDPEVRWRAAFAFSRTGDSLDLASRTARIQELLNDQGTPYCRMFAATILGRLHNAWADTQLYRAYRGEKDWRVRVNILNAIAKFNALDSQLFITLVRATHGARKEDPPSIHIGLTAQSVLEQMIRKDRIPSAFKPIVRTWINSFADPDILHPDIARIVQAATCPAAVLLETPNDTESIKSYGQAGRVEEREYSVRAMGSTSNPAYFANLLSTMTYVSPLEQLWRLEALDSMWQRAKKDAAFRAELERTHFANIYRYLLIRVSDVVQDPAVVTTALDHMRDSSILVDTLFRGEANRYVAKYLKSFCDRWHRDQLLSAVTAEGWIVEHSQPLQQTMFVVLDSAYVWSDHELADSVVVVLARMGIVFDQKPLPKRVSHIDWNYLESLPDKMTINMESGPIQIKLLPHYAPLTVLSMVKLAKGPYFGDQRVHRVVPNFVIQSGDITGTGWGGPGYTIRSEFTPREYGREGVVGMARDGKDTEGSQWFITHCPTPHLDSRYTIWGEVTGGMNTVMSTLQGDRVQTVIVSK